LAREMVAGGGIISGRRWRFEKRKQIPFEDDKTRTARTNKSKGKGENPTLSDETAEGGAPGSCGG
jgi:hypothetical protein